MADGDDWVRSLLPWLAWRGAWAVALGLMIANLIPVLLAWHRSATGLRLEPAGVPLAYRLVLTALSQIITGTAGDTVTVLALISTLTREQE
jgi:hypothetical protein